MAGRDANPPGADRDATIDVAKGLAIAAIVFGHVWDGLHSAQLLPSDELYASVKSVVYLWHLSLFALAAGLFVERGMIRRGPWRYVRDRDLTFLWLYLVWTAIQGAVKLAADGLVNSRTSWWEVLAVWIPSAQLWFFGWIALVMVLAALTRPWVSPSRLALVLVAATVVSVAAWGLDGPYLFQQGIALTVFFFVGLVVRGDRLRWILGRIPPAAAGLGAAAGAAILVVAALGLGATPPTVEGDTRTVASVAAGVVASSAGVVAVLLLSRLVTLWRPLARPLASMGEQSLVIFVGHIVFTAGCRILLVRLGVDSVVVQVIAGTLLGIVGPLLLARVATRVHAGWLFAAPHWLVPAAPAPVGPAADPAARAPGPAEDGRSSRVD